MTSISEVGAYNQKGLAIIDGDIVRRFMGLVKIIPISASGGWSVCIS